MIITISTPRPLTWADFDTVLEQWGLDYQLYDNSQLIRIEVRGLGRMAYKGDKVHLVGNANALMDIITMVLIYIQTAPI